MKNGFGSQENQRSLRSDLRLHPSSVSGKPKPCQQLWMRSGTTTTASRRTCEISPLMSESDSLQSDSGFMGCVKAVDVLIRWYLAFHCSLHLKQPGRCFSSAAPRPYSPFLRSAGQLFPRRSGTGKRSGSEPKPQSYRLMLFPQISMSASPRPRYLHNHQELSGLHRRSSCQNCTQLWVQSENDAFSTDNNGPQSDARFKWM